MRNKWVSTWGLGVGCLATLFPSMATTLERNPPAYITNAYFSDRLVQDDDSIKPSAVINVLKAYQTGTMGYFIMDVVLGEPGVHRFFIEVSNQEGEILTKLNFDPVTGGQKEENLYTVVGAVAGSLPPGMLNFKVFDRVEQQPARALNTFNILIKEWHGEKETQLASLLDGLSMVSDEAKLPLGNYQFAADFATSATSLGGEPQPALSLPPVDAGAPDRSKPPQPLSKEGSRTGKWTLFMGSFSDAGNAAKLAERIEHLGFPVQRREIDVKGQHFHRVTVGPFATPEEALTAKGRVSSATGSEGTVKSEGPVAATAALPKVESVAPPRKEVTKVDAAPPEALPKVEAVAPTRKEVAKVDAAPPPSRLAPLTPVAKSESKSEKKPQVVQLGSFAEKSQADAARKRLTALGLPTFVRESGSEAGGGFRVYAGPFPDGDEALQMKGLIEAEAGMAGEVMAMPAPVADSGPAVAPKPLPTPPAAKPAEVATTNRAEEPKAASVGPIPPRRNPPPAPVVAAPPASYVVQIFSSAAMQEAQEMANRLQKGGWPIFVKGVDVASTRRWQVFVGPFDTQRDAEEANRELADSMALAGTVEVAPEEKSSGKTPRRNEAPGSPPPSGTAPDSRSRPGSQREPVRGLGIEVASYLDVVEAKAMQERLQGLKIPASVRLQVVESVPLHQVVVGPLADATVVRNHAEMIHRVLGINAEVVSLEATSGKGGLTGREKVETLQLHLEGQKSLPKTYTVFAGFYGEAQNAERLRQRIARQGLPALGEVVTVRGKTMNSVCAGPFPAEGKARDAAEMIRRQLGVAQAVVRDSDFSGAAS
ncbi:MAG: SPOR domain-containing protein, partial [Magnetococcales bacterium]|nr:SPOR domain-containing protein [Magnetococcales bacterium]